MLRGEDGNPQITRTMAVTGVLTGGLECGIVGKQTANDSQLVVIGSSAGGIEALSRVVASLPSNFPAPIVIAQHLDPRRPSHLGEILARHATLPIKVVDDNAALDDGVIFVVPSNRLVEIVDGELRLRPAKSGKVAPSVDLLLETAATAFGPLSERAMRVSLERLMAAAGHELKTPTAAIHNYLQLVDRHLSEGDTDKASTYAGRALAQTRRLATLIERLLDVSRIQAGQLELLLQVVDLTTVVRSAVEVAQVLPKAPVIRVRASRAQVRVRADPGRLEQVFLNLLANAIEHAPGSGTIDVTVRTSEGHGVVAVRDHGGGIAREHIRTMFEPYTRLGHPHRAPGLGLGLYVAREIVVAHGGEIEATSRIGKGTVLTVRLPVARRRARRALVDRGAAGADRA
jgi:signal transduction histidine kinase